MNAFEHRFLTAAARPRPRPRSVPGADRHLPLAVVAEGRGLQHRRPADASRAPREIGFRSERPRTAPPAGRGRARNVFSRMRCCAISSARPFGPDDRVLLGRGRGRRRHVLELERHDVDAARELADAVEVVVRRRRPRRRQSGRSACRARARGCGRGSRGGARPWRTCARAGRRRARRWSIRER